MVGILPDVSVIAGDGFMNLPETTGKVKVKAEPIQVLPGLLADDPKKVKWTKKSNSATAPVSLCRSSGLELRTRHRTSKILSPSFRAMIDRKIQIPTARQRPSLAVPALIQPVTSEIHE